MERLSAYIGFGLVTASVLSLSAVGATLQMGVTNIINVAYAAIITLGGFVAYWLSQAGANVWVALFVGGLVGAVASVMQNRFVFVPYLRRGSQHFELVMVSLAVALIIEFVLAGITQSQTFVFVMDQGQTLKWGGLTLTTSQLYVIGIAVVLMLALHLLLGRTRLGKAMRATASNASLAKNCGIRTKRTVDWAWLLSGFLGGLGGAVYFATSGTLSASGGLTYLPLFIAPVILGGVGRVHGAMVASLILGLAMEIVAGYGGSSYKELVAFGILVIVALVRPSGLLGGESMGALGAGGRT